MCISCHKVEPDPGSKATPRQPSKPSHAWPRPAQWGAARARRAAGEEIFWHAFPKSLRPAAAAALGGARREAALAPKMSELPARHHYTPHWAFWLRRFHKSPKMSEIGNSNAICKNCTHWWMRNISAEFVVPFSSYSHSLALSSLFKVKTSFFEWKHHYLNNKITIIQPNWWFFHLIPLFEPKNSVMWWLFHDDLTAREWRREEKVTTNSAP